MKDRLAFDGEVTRMTSPDPTPLDAAVAAYRMAIDLVTTQANSDRLHVELMRGVEAMDMLVIRLAIHTMRLSGEMPTSSTPDFPRLTQ